MLEHIQWADEASIAFLQQLLLDTRQPIPILVLMTARTTSEEVPPLWQQDTTFNPQQLILEPLSHDLAVLLTAEVLRNMVEIPPQLLSTLLENSHGNPRHLFELLRRLLDDEVILQTDDGWRLDAVAFQDFKLFTMPELVQARLHSLSEAAQILVMCGAVIGDIFWDKAVRHSAQFSDETDYQAALDELVSAAIIFPLDTTNFPTAVEYQFTNGMLQRWLYENTPPAARHAYHARYASWLIGQGMNRVAQYAGVIAHHYQQTQDVQRAIKWHLLAARQSEQSFSPLTAIHHYEQVLLLARRNSANFQEAYVTALMGLADIYDGQARFADALDAWQETLAVSKNAIQAATALVKMARLYNHLGHPHEALSKAEQAVTLLEEAGQNEHEGLGKAWLNISRAYRRLGNHSEAFTYAEKALGFGQSIKNESLIADTYNVLGTIYVSAGQNSEMATIYFNKALETARRQGNLTLVAQLSNNIAESARMRGDFQSALVMYRKTQEAAQRIGNQQVVISSIVNTGAAWLGLQKFSKAAESLQQALALLGHQSEGEAYCEALWLYATALIGLGEYPEAQAVLYQVYDVAVHLSQPAMIAAVWRTCGSWCGATRQAIQINGQPYDAVACFQQSYAMLDQNELLLEKAHTLRTWGFYLIDSGQPAEAIVLWKEAIVLMGTAGATYQQETMQGILDDLMQQNGQLGTE